MSENYIPLYRKYRPQTLDTLVGQEHVKKTLTNAIELNKIAHAYLFTGPRGTGKTSTARILAKSLNCKNGPTIHPCGECESCRDITNTVPIDVIEIDAASNRTVEDAQNILEKIQYAPVHGKYKIYVIDEVHMLSNHAFNALLKTLEEPPENVIFILATTEVHKVLDTIKSRCQRFDFRRITTDDIVKHLRYISDKENINITDDALYTIAKNCAGGMRDSISLLDQLSLLGISNEVTSDDVNAILGRISFDILNKLSEAIISSSPNKAIEIINDIYNSGNEPLQILTNLSEYFKNLLIIKNSNKELFQELTGLNESQISLLNEQKEKLETQQIVFLLERITYYVKEINQAQNQHLWLEVGIIDLANMAENTKLIELQNRVSALENGVQINHQYQQPAIVNVTRPAPVQPEEIKENRQVQNNTTQEKRVENSTSHSAEEFTPPPMSKKSDGSDIHSLWEKLLLNIKSAPTRALLNLAKPVKIDEKEIIITLKNEKLVSQITSTNKKELLVEAGNTLFGTTGIKVTVRLPQAGDENIQNSDFVSKNEKNINPDEKKNLIEHPKENIDTSAEKQAPENNIINTDDQDNDNDNIIKQEKETHSPHYESDQEKMVLELFDGKFVE